MRRWSLRHERLLRSTLSATESEQQRGDGEAKSAGASHKMLAISTKAKSAGASRCRVSSTSSSEATARQRRLERHTGCLPSALAQPTRSKLPSSIEHRQQRGNGEAQAAGASRKTVAISTHSLEYEQAAVEQSARAAARQWRGQGGWRITQDGRDLLQLTREAAGCCRASSTSSSKKTARLRWLSLHATWLGSAPANPNRSLLPSSTEHEQSEGGWSFTQDGRDQH